MRFATLVLTFALAGCVTHYSVPEGQPTATISFSSPRPQFSSLVRVQAFSDRQCGKSPHGTTLAIFTSGTAREFDNPAGTERKVIAGSEFVYTFYYGMTTMTNMISSTTCKVTTAFLPEPNRLYKAHLEIGADGCSATLNRVATDGETLEAVASAHVTPACFDAIN